MLRRKVINQEFNRRIYDNPEVKVWDGELNKALKVLKARSGAYGTMRVLRFRRDYPGKGDRRRAKAIMAQDRSKRMLEKEGS